MRDQTSKGLTDVKLPRNRGNRSLLRAIAVIALLGTSQAALVSAPAMAQSLVPGGTAATPTPDPRTAPPPLAAETPSDANRPFGAKLFSGSASSVDKPAGLSPSYRIAPGDQVAVHLYGAVSQDLQQPVDHQGNIFLPQIGPVPVAGVAAGDLTSHLQQSLQRSYPSESVQVYGTVTTGHPLGVFVTGFVKQPGRHLGTPSDSIIDFLVKAGGIQDGSGSYREVTLRRGRRDILDIDLYQFLLSGDLPDIELEEGDTIVVGAQHPTVKAIGEARNLAIFEFPNRNAMKGSEVLTLARPLPSVTNVLITGTRSGEPYSTYVDLAKFAQFELHDQDSITFMPDASAPTVTVKLEGSFLGPSTYVLDQQTTLLALLDQIAVNPEVANIRAISLRRASVAAQQKKALNGALERLQRSVLTAVVNTSGEATLRSAEATMVLQFIDRVRAAVPDGTLVVTDDEGRIADIPLENSDTIIIPKRSSTILISGEVLAPQTLIWQPGVNIYDYIALSGGFTDRADDSRFLVEKQNGALILASNPTLDPGDQLIVLPDMSFKSFQFINDITETIFRIAGVARFFND